MKAGCLRPLNPVYPIGSENPNYLEHRGKYPAIIFVEVVPFYLYEFAGQRLPALDWLWNQ